MNKTIVFGGWAVPPGLLKFFFGNDARYIDINRVMPKLFVSDELRVPSKNFNAECGMRNAELKVKGNINPFELSEVSLMDDWPDIIISEYQLTAGNTPDVIAGWSTGAMFAYAVARKFCPKKLILLSATPCFCRRDDFRFGTRPAVLDQMTGALVSDRDAVLRSFYERSGLAYDPSAVSGYTTGELVRGLMFLKQADLRPVMPLSIKPVFYHGADDLIIPISASRYFSERAGGELVEAGGGGHAFFAGDYNVKVI